MHQYPRGLPLRREVSHTGTPTTKVVKGSTIITKYPPPPGYARNTKSNKSFRQSPPWPQPFQSHTYNQPASGALTPPVHVQPAYQTSHSQQTFPGHAVQPVPQAHTQKGWHTPSQPQAGPESAWSPPAANDQITQLQVREDYAYMYAIVSSERADQASHHYLPAQANEELESAFDDEYSFASAPEEIDRDLSLGSIEWKAPVPTRRAIPAPSADTETEALHQLVSQPDDDTCVSEYFAQPRREQALLSVRDTEAWETMKDDLIFRDFRQMPTNIVSWEDQLAQYRIRIDLDWDKRNETPRESTADFGSEYVSGHCMETNESGRPTNIQDSFYEAAPISRTHSRRSSMHSQAGSISSQRSAKYFRHKPLPPVRDEQQEDALAALGVTGSPKVVYHTPGPSFGPPLTGSSIGSGISSRSNSIGSAHGSWASMSVRENSPSCSTRASGDDDHERPSYSYGRRIADTYDGDVDVDIDATPRAKCLRSDIRKRSYADCQVGLIHNGMPEDDEPTPKQRRRSLRVDSAHHCYR